jgi:hypothetical protein
LSFESVLVECLKSRESEGFSAKVSTEAERCWLRSRQFIKGYWQLVGFGSICGTRTKTVPLTIVSVAFQLKTKNNFSENVGHMWFAFRKYFLEILNKNPLKFETILFPFKKCVCTEKRIQVNELEFPLF